MWESVFAPKYGSPGEPTYLIIKVPTIINSKKDMVEYLDNIQDVEIKNNLKDFLTKYNKEVITTFRPPHNIVTSSGIPEEILPVIDYKRIV